ncbi:hypothetical protein [Methylophaga sp.]|uniref:hypothetical protein n=1 Tax=Methylophaga sp. TaxID=2024840 RepID=UPI00271DCC87|nr:hypothetical protein [Methylophaga sp.]MDO8827973.1 hypothetical protein [Methylophaga sp.]
MRNKLIKYLIPALFFTVAQTVFADSQPSLTSEQLRHEQALTELRKQKEILELKHSQAQLIRDCHEMGIDCRGTSLEIKPDTMNDLTAEIERLNVPMAPVTIDESSFSIDNISSTRNVSPTLEAIQNDSARLKHSGETQWALVGDKVGDWVITHIDATKVRIKNSRNSTSKTLVLNW